MSKALEAFDMALTYRSPSGRVYVDVGPTREYIIALEERVKELEVQLVHMAERRSRAQKRGSKLLKRAEQAEADLATETDRVSRWVLADRDNEAWAGLNNLLEQAEAALSAMTLERDLAVAHDRQPYPTAWAYEKVCASLHEKEADLAALEATNERLRCCGNCDELGGDYGDECCRSWLGPVEPPHAYRPTEDVKPYDSCHFTPSRWTRRET